MNNIGVKFQEYPGTRQNLSMPKIHDSKQLAKTQYDKIMHNFEKEQRVNTQKIKGIQATPYYFIYRMFRNGK